MKTIFRKKTELASLHPEKNSPDLAEIIFKGEIEMSRRRAAKVRDLPLHPYLRKSFLQKVLDLLGQFCDGQDVTERKF